MIYSYQSFIGKLTQPTSKDGWFFLSYCLKGKSQQCFSSVFIHSVWFGIHSGGDGNQLSEEFNAAMNVAMNALGVF